MKRMILAITVIGAISSGTYAQTNRNYNTDMQNNRISADERRAGRGATGIIRLNVDTEDQQKNEIQDRVKLNTIQVFEGYRGPREVDKVQGCSGVEADWSVRAQKQSAAFSLERIESFQGISSRQLSRTVGMDTSLTNGHCIGCGSRASWKRGHSYNPATDELIFGRPAAK